MTNLKEKYVNEIVPELKKELGYGNVMQVPEVEKITLNMGVGESITDKKSNRKSSSRSGKHNWSKTFGYKS